MLIPFFLELVTLPPYFEAEYCLFCGRRRVAVARYRMICLVLVMSTNLLSFEHPSLPLFCLNMNHIGNIVDNDECLHSAVGYDYQGRVHTTESGKECQRWDSMVGHKLQVFIFA